MLASERTCEWMLVGGRETRVSLQLTLLVSEEEGQVVLTDDCDRSSSSSVQLSDMYTPVYSDVSLVQETLAYCSKVRRLFLNLTQPFLWGGFLGFFGGYF